MIGTALLLPGADSNLLQIISNVSATSPVPYVQHWPLFRQVSSPTGIFTLPKSPDCEKSSKFRSTPEASEQVPSDRLFALMVVVVVRFLTAAQILSDPKQPGSLTGWLVSRNVIRSLRSAVTALARRLLISDSNTE
ncbi:hypothetical protein [Bradyrhizobium sp. DASA03007]|uniref:hypothetical protein n=1 Tax=unclassified Bradyrhizobium TaxID=2631580 RepID=UPI003F715436